MNPFNILQDLLVSCLVPLFLFFLVVIVCQNRFGEFYDTYRLNIFRKVLLVYCLILAIFGEHIIGNKKEQAENSCPTKHLLNPRFQFIFSVTAKQTLEEYCSYQYGFLDQVNISCTMIVKESKDRTRYINVTLKNKTGSLQKRTFLQSKKESDIIVSKHTEKHLSVSIGHLSYDFSFNETHQINEDYDHNKLILDLARKKGFLPATGTSFWKIAVFHMLDHIFYRNEFIQINNCNCK